MSKSIIIIGASLAGVSCAQRLLASDQDLHISLISDEADVAYDRPPLSKGLKIGEPVPVVDLDPTKQLDSDRLTLFAGQPAQSIDAAGKTVEVNGVKLPFDKLVIATGARARMITAYDLPGTPIKTLRTKADAEEIKALVEKHANPRVGIVGGGFIGLELASALSEGATVDLFEAQERLLSRVLPPEISSRVEQRHKDAGVNLHMGAHIADVNASSDSVFLELNDGEKFEFDLLVLGIGAVPNIELADEAGLELANGIAVNEHLETSVADIYAVGDCCSFPLALNGERVRVESWRNAQEQGHHVADQILSGEKAKFEGLPWFWSDQYDLGLQMAGWGHPESKRAVRESGDNLLVFELDMDHRVIAVAGIGPGNSVAKDVKLCERLINKRAQIEPEQLADASVNMKVLLKAAG